MQDPEHWQEWIDGGATVAAATVATQEDPAAALAKIARWHRWLRENGDRVTPITTVEDIGRAKSDDKLGVLFQFQNITPLGGELDLLDSYQRLGVRIIQICYNRRNYAGDGCLETEDAGLSSFGQALIREMGQTGMVIDLSHVGHRTSLEALELATTPPVFSHSNARRICDHRRNLHDDQIQAVAARGGLVGINAFPAFVKATMRPSIDHIMEHIDYLVELVGAEYVGLGLDFFVGSQAEYQEMTRRGLWSPSDYPPWPYAYPTGLEDAGRLPNLTAALRDRGYPEEAVLVILGGNWIRVFRDCWRS